MMLIFVRLEVKREGQGRAGLGREGLLTRVCVVEPTLDPLPSFQIPRQLACGLGRTE